MIPAQHVLHSRPQRPALTLALAALLVFVGACGSEDSPEVASLAETETSEDEAVDPEAEEALLAASQCMRDNGVDSFPDPVVEADGSVNIDRNGLLTAGIDPSSTEFRDAAESCASHLEGVTLGGGGFADDAEIADALLEFAECMRDEGLEDFPDPAADMTIDGPFGGAVDLDDPAVSAAATACQAAFAEVGFGADE